MKYMHHSTCTESRWIFVSFRHDCSQSVNARSRKVVRLTAAQSALSPQRSVVHQMSPHVHSTSPQVIMCRLLDGWNLATTASPYRPHLGRAGGRFLISSTEHDDPLMTPRQANPIDIPFFGCLITPLAQSHALIFYTGVHAHERNSIPLH
jgi:hypothetical protein